MFFFDRFLHFISFLKVFKFTEILESSSLRTSPVNLKNPLKIRTKIFRIDEMSKAVSRQYSIVGRLLLLSSECPQNSGKNMNINIISSVTCA